MWFNYYNDNVNLNTEMHSHITYCIVILHFTFQIEYWYPNANPKVRATE